MALNAGATIIPGRGTVFVAAVDTAPPAADAAALATLDPLTPTTYTGWDCIGHTSRENTVAFTKDGGDSTNQGSWWDESLRTNYDPTSWGFTVNSLQVDALTMQLAFGGGTHDGTAGTYDVKAITAVSRAVFILAVDSTARLGLWAPNASVTVGDAPDFPVDGFLEIQLSAAANTSSTTGTRFRWIAPGLVTPAGG